MPGVPDSLSIFSLCVTGWDEKSALDIWYVDHRIFWLDMKIVVMTFFKVFARAGINSDKAATMEEFRGSGR